MKRRQHPSKILFFFIVVPLVLLAGLAVYVVKPFFFSPTPADVRYVSVCETTCPETHFPYQDPSLSTEERTTDLMQRMTNAEKIGQMALIEKNSIKDSADIAKYGLGALMSGGGAKPDENTPEGWLHMVTAFQRVSQRTRLGIPLFYGVDANHGHSNVPGAALFPHAIGLAASNDPALVRKVAIATAEEVAATGMNWVYSPNLDVAQDMRWGRAYETFGSDPKRVGTLGRASVEGLQSVLQNDSRIAASAKHYVGNGSTEWGSSTNIHFSMDQGNSKISEAELRRMHLEPFKQAIEADVKSVMVGLNKWNGEKIVFHTYLLTDVLKQELGFKGFVVSDWYGVYENEWDRYHALVKAINAGVDMVMLPFDYAYFSESMHHALANGDISQTRVDDAVYRILRAKFETGIFDHALPEVVEEGRIGSLEHRELARMAVQKSLVLLKNENTLPLSKKTPHILVAGSAADNIGKQSGGWTVEWQGIDGNWIPGSTMLKGIQDAVSPSTKVEYDLAAHFNDLQGLADIGIAVVGEKPYAEGWGDDAHPTLSLEDRETIARLKKQSRKIVVVIVSGRPLDITADAKDWNAVVAAWLPGSEGAGVADGLFGNVPFTGTLPVEWALN